MLDFVGAGEGNRTLVVSLGSAFLLWDKSLKNNKNITLINELAQYKIPMDYP